MLFGGFEKSHLFVDPEVSVGLTIDRTPDLSSESVECTSLTFQGVDHIHSSDSLSLCMLAVCNSITDDVLEEDLENSAGLFVDQATDTLHPTSSCQSTDSGLGDSLDVITQNLSVPLGTSFAKTLSSFTASRHSFLNTWDDMQMKLG